MKKKSTAHIVILSNYPRILPNEAEDIALIFAKRIDAGITRLKLEKDNKMYEAKSLGKNCIMK